MRILLFRLGALGDVLLTTPLLRQLRKRFSRARIDYLTGESFAAALKGNPYADEVMTFPEKIFFERNYFGLVPLARMVRKRAYDLAFVLDRHWVFPLVTFLFGVPRRVGFDRAGREGVLLTDRVPFGEVRHEIHYYLDLLDRVAASDRKDVRMDFFPSEKDAAWAEKFLTQKGLSGKRFVCVAPGGGKNAGQDMPWKRWPPAGYASLIRLLEKEGTAAVLVGGPMDAPLEKEILAQAGAVSAVGVSVGQSAALLARAHAVVCSDGGAMHLAAAVNDRVVSIFGPTDPRRLAPLNGIGWLWKPENCGPCYDVYGRFRACSQGHRCMHGVTAEEVLEVLRRGLAGQPPAGGPG